MAARMPFQSIENVTHHLVSHKKTTVPRAYHCRGNGKWCLELRYTPCKGAKSKAISSGYRYATKEEALKDAERWRDEKEWPKELSRQRSCSSADAPAAGGSTAGLLQDSPAPQADVPGRSRNSMWRLSAPEKSAFKKQKAERKAEGEISNAPDFLRLRALDERTARAIKRAWDGRAEKVEGRLQKSSYYLAERLELLQNRIADLQSKATRLQRASILSTFDDLLDFSVPDDNESVPKAVRGTLSLAQHKRLSMQATVVHLFLMTRIDRDRQEADLVEGARTLVESGRQEVAALPSKTPKKRVAKVTKQANHQVFVKMKEIEEKRIVISTPILATNVVLQVSHVPNAPGAQTVLRWANEYIRDGPFKADGRGIFERDFILQNDDLKNNLLTYMKEEKRLSVDKVWKYVNEVLLRDEGVINLAEKYNLSSPVGRTTVHRWMIKIGCMFKRASKSYYTDGHNQPKVVQYRSKYTDTLGQLSERMPLWMQSRVSDLRTEDYEALVKTSPRGEIFHYVQDGNKWVEFHVDRLSEGDKKNDLYALARDCATMNGFGVHDSVRFQEAAAIPCKYGHASDGEGKCRCSMRALHVGQDERIFKALLREGKDWVIRGTQGLREKTEGPGEMVSAVQAEVRGFVLKMTEAELARVNEGTRKRAGHPPLRDSPGVRFLAYGKNKEGYWNYEMFAEQVVDLLDCYEELYPDHQVVLEVDQSSGHAKGREDGLRVSSMNMKYGGKQERLRDTVVCSECLGEKEATMRLGYVKYDCKLKPGDAQRMVFGPDDPPPFYLPYCPKRDVAEMIPNTSRNDGVRGKKQTPGETRRTKVVREGYVGKPKEEKHVLWERGLWEDSWTGVAAPGGRSQADRALSNCKDFREEKTLFKSWSRAVGTSC